MKNIARSEDAVIEGPLNNITGHEDLARNSSVFLDVARGLDPNWSSALRSIALAVILLRAGRVVNRIA